MAVLVLNSTAVPCISFIAIRQVSATNPPQTQSCKTLAEIQFLSLASQKYQSTSLLHPYAFLPCF